VNHLRYGVLTTFNETHLLLLCVHLYINHCSMSIIFCVFDVRQPSKPTLKRVWLVLLTLDQESGGEGFSGVPHYPGPRTKMPTTALAVVLVSLPASSRPSKKKKTCTLPLTERQPSKTRASTRLIRLMWYFERLLWASGRVLECNPWVGGTQEYHKQFRRDEDVCSREYSSFCSLAFYIPFFWRTAARQ
jgi:hypothetical protein